MKRKNKNTHNKARSNEDVTLTPEQRQAQEQMKRLNRKDNIGTLATVAVGLAAIGAFAFSLDRYSEDRADKKKQIEIAQEMLKAAGTEVGQQELKPDTDEFGVQIQAGKWFDVSSVPITVENYDTRDGTPQIYSGDVYGIATIPAPTNKLIIYPAEDSGGLSPYAGMAGDALGAAAYYLDETSDEQGSGPRVIDRETVAVKLPYLADSLEDLSTNELVVGVDKPGADVKARIVDYGEEYGGLWLQLKKTDEQPLLVTFSVSKKE